MSPKQLLAPDFLIDGRPAPLRLVVNSRAKRLIVKIDQATGIVVVTAPSRRDVPEALAFAESRKDWIREQLAAAPRRIPFRAGLRVPFRGAPHVIRRDGGSRALVRREYGALPALVVGGEAPHLARRLTDWLKREARKTLTERTDVYAAAAGRPRGRITIRETRTRWGSCSADGSLSFNWRLIMAPPFVLDYVAAHECAHLVEMNHSQDFWDIVERLIGDSERPKAWLRENGAKLHAYGASAT